MLGLGEKRKKRRKEKKRQDSSRTFKFGCGFRQGFNPTRISPAYSYIQCTDAIWAASSDDADTRGAFSVGTFSTRDPPLTGATLPRPMPLPLSQPLPQPRPFVTGSSTGSLMGAMGLMSLYRVLTICGQKREGERTGSPSNPVSVNDLLAEVCQKLPEDALYSTRKEQVQYQYTKPRCTDRITRLLRQSEPPSPIQSVYRRKVCYLTQFLFSKGWHSVTLGEQNGLLGESPSVFGGL
uniref:Uncharacterized protein n=1 Tax=Solanum tuberosum TaxID=4113 RepID=M1DN78_SOLTU